MKILVLLLVTIYTVSVAQGEYHRGVNNQNCANDEVIKLETECITASESLGLSFQFESTSTNYPAGCYYSTNSQRSFFNQILDLATTSPGYHGFYAGVCKKEEETTTAFPTTPPVSDDNGCFDVKLTTKRYGSEISWSLGSCQGNGGYGNYGEYTEQCCLEPGDYNLECKDSYGDGWHGGYIEVNGEKYCDSFSSGSEKNSQIIIEGNVVGCSDVYSDSVCSTDCDFWLKIKGCAYHFPSNCEASGKIKEYCKASCNNCGGCYDSSDSDYCSSQLIPNLSCQSSYVKRVCRRSCGLCST